MIPDPRTIAADLMTSYARDIDRIDVWAHIGQAYDVDVVEANIDAGIADQVVDLIAAAGIDLIWPDGSTDTELDAQRVEVERLRAELEQARERLFAQGPVIEAVEAWAEAHDHDDAHTRLSAAPPDAALYAAVEEYRLMDAALTAARAEAVAL